MEIDKSILEKINNSADLSAIPLNKALHTLSLDNENLRDFANQFSQEGNWCRLGTSSLIGAERRGESQIQFQIGKKGLFVGKDQDGRKKFADPL